MPVNPVRPKGWTDPATTARFWAAMEEAQRCSVGRRIKQLRKQRGWSSETLAQEANVSSKTVSRLENGRVENPHDATLQKIADALGKHLEDIAGPRLVSDDGTGPIERLTRIELKLDALVSGLLNADAAAELERELDEALAQDSTPSTGTAASGHAHGRHRSTR